MRGIRRFLSDEDGDAVVEAAILFPVIIMIFSALVVISMYLPQSVNLQRAAQYAAVTAANLQSDTGYTVNASTAEVSANYYNLSNVYVQLFSGMSPDDAEISEKIVQVLAEQGFAERNSVLKADCKVVKNYIIYREIEVTVTETITLPIDFTFIGLGKTIELRKSARCVIQNSDELIRNLDLAGDVAKAVDERFKISDKLGESLKKLKDFFNF